jgi:hypothetical protein
MRKHLVTISMLVIGLAVFTSCMDNKDQNTVTEAKLITEMKSAFHQAEDQDKCSLILTPVVQKYIPLGTSKEEAIRVLEENGFGYIITSKSERTKMDGWISKNTPLDEDEEFELLSASYRMPPEPFIFTTVSFGLSVEFHKNKAIGLRGKVLCTSL